MTELEKAALTDDDLDCIDMAATQEANQNPHGTHYHWRKAYLRAFANALTKALATTDPGEQTEREAWVPYLVDRADGVKGHYAIGRWNPRGYREVWNLHSHRWAAYSDDVMSLEEADSLLRQITIPTVRASLPATTERKGEPVAELKELFRAAVDWGRTYGRSYSLDHMAVDDACEHWASQALPANTSPQVPEDTELLDWLSANPGASIVEHGGIWFFGSNPYDSLREAIEAARKGGEVMSKDFGALNERPFVMVSPQGLSYVGLHKDEADCWQVALGWPSDDEIAARKTEGYAVYPATLTWQKASNTPPQVPEDVQMDAERYRFLAEKCRSTSEHWGGRWSIVIEGPAPKSHDSEDDLDEAIDAARKGE